MRLIKIVIGGLAAGLILSACANVPSAQDVQAFVQEHTECATATYTVQQWSPDGAFIYYVLMLPDPSGHVLSARAVRSSGGYDRLLADDIGEMPSLSPDGTMLLVERDTVAAWTYRYDILDTQTGVSRRIGEWGKKPVWSPDSQWIFFRAGGLEQGPFYRVDARTGESVRLTGAPASRSTIEWGPAWSPDDRRFAYSSGHDWLESVFIADSAGGDVLPVPLRHDPECMPSEREVERVVPGGWSPDGSTVAVMQRCKDRSTLRFVTPEGKELLSWGRIYDEVYFWGWSPDSTRLLVSTIVNGDWHIGVADFDGTLVHLFPVTMTLPSWSPDGKHILLQDHTTWSVYVSDADGSNLRLLQAFALNPTWSPDPGGTGSGTRIAFVGRDQAGMQAVFTIQPDGSGLTQLTQNPGAGRMCLH